MSNERILDMDKPDTARSLLSFRDLPDGSFEELLYTYIVVPSRGGTQRRILSNRYIGLLFLCPSTRTRSSFWRAASELGAQTINFSPNDLQITTGESLFDTGRVLRNYIDALVFRNNGLSSESEMLSSHIPVVINAMDDSEHPTQGVADFVAIQEHFGTCEGLRIAYFGPGNNIANTIAFLFSRLPGAVLNFYCPECHSLKENVLLQAKKNASRHGGEVAVYNRIPPTVEPVDIIYTTRWRSMGKSPEIRNWLMQFAPFRVDARLWGKFAIPGRTVFMHDLPATRGEEVTADIIDGEMSIVWRQAHHKLTSAKICLAWCFRANFD